VLIVIAYVAFIAYAAGLFIYSVTHDRPWAALGILLSVSGFQFALMDTVNADLSILVAVIGLLMMGRDVYIALSPRLVPVRVRANSRHVDQGMP
jgi:hypothetical protein